MAKINSAFRRYILIALMSICISANARTGHNQPTDNASFPLLLSNTADAEGMKYLTDSIYDVIGLSNYGLDKTTFYSACIGYQYLLNKGLLKKKNLLTICDYSQSSNNKRLYVINLSTNSVVFNTYVAHGKNSGEEFATSFSNVENSNKSNLGFMVTDDTYYGIAGYSMRFNGMEFGINDHVRMRNIVLHGSKYVNETVMQQRGMIGHSLGCPAVPNGIHREIIDAIKGGSCFFIYNPAAWYTHTSRIINSKAGVLPVMAHVSTSANVSSAIKSSSSYDEAEASMMPTNK